MKAKPPSMVDEMRAQREKRSSEPKPAAEGGAPNKQSAPSKRFAWRDNVVAPRAPMQHDMHKVAAPAPKPDATGTLAPIDLKRTRRMVAQARTDKKKVVSQ